MNMHTLHVRVTGTAPLLMHSDRLSNPLDPVTRAHSLLTFRGKKTEEAHLAIARSEWQASMYHDKALGPYIPAQNFESCMVAGAKLQKLGVKFKQGVMVLEDKVKLAYKGPREVDKLWDAQVFTDVRGVRVGTSRVPRCRPKFDDWAAEFTITYNPSLVEERDVLLSLSKAGELIGIGDFRPRFGRFTVEVLS